MFLQQSWDATHALSVHYRGVSSKTLSRDIDFLEKCQLIVRADGKVRANLSIMERYKL